MPLTVEFAPYGDVIAPEQAMKVRHINYGNTDRFHNLANLNLLKDGGPRPLPRPIPMPRRGSMGCQSLRRPTSKIKARSHRWRGDQVILCSLKS